MSAKKKPAVKKKTKAPDMVIQTAAFDPSTAQPGDRVVDENNVSWRFLFDYGDYALLFDAQGNTKVAPSADVKLHLISATD